MVISRVIIRVTPLRAPIFLLITYLLSPLPLQVTAPPPPPDFTLGFENPRAPRVEARCGSPRIVVIIYVMT